ncbi:MAG TPA: YbaB/EbfC family nucleoid-associated protein [Eubacteriales bacterium]|nr:YbaB/EbfC family nucleoid-associated protein [Clostridia bacterium]HRV72989.1 YbaB/EbfC family nucleoid-associated protein [Eubacteriales bacterium]
MARYPNMGGGNMQQLMRQAQKMQQDMQQKQEELNGREFTAQAGGGMVKATVYGTRQLKGVEINPDCVDPDDVEMLQDLVVAAVNAAIAEANETVERELGRLTGGMNLGF